MHRLLRPLLLIALAAVTAQADPSPAAGPVPALRAPDGALPDDAALEAAGARIGTITIRNGPIFDLGDPRQNHALFRLANRLHLRTRAGAVRAQLLFHSGERYQARLLAETERNLRQVSFLREPRVRPVAWHDGVVDILVETHDVWTLQLGPSYGRSGGKSNTSVEFEDDNLLGYGKTLLTGHSRNVDRTATYLEWQDPTVLGSHWVDDLRWADNSDGHLYGLQLYRPFYALDVRQTAGVLATDSTEADTRYLLGAAYDQYRHAARSLNAFGGWSSGLVAGHALRFTVGWQEQRDRFSPLYLGTPPVNAALAPIPANRDLAYPYLQLDWLTDRFRTTHNQDLIGRTEDLQFGLNATLQTGLAAPVFGADRHALVYTGQVAYGWALSSRQQLYATSAVAGRIEQGRAVDLSTSAAASWYWRTSRHTLSYARVSGDAGHRLDLDHYYSLGGDTGLRGYPLRYQLGSALAQIRIEERGYTDYSIWQLFNVGGALFFDAGRTFGANPIGDPQLGWLRDVGLGLRLGNNRSSLGRVIHVDFATPLNGRNLSRVQFLVSTEATF